MRSKSRICTFLDIEMPGMDGLAVAKQIRETDSKALLVFLTSYTKSVSYTHLDVYKRQRWYCFTWKCYVNQQFKAVCVFT